MSNAQYGFLIGLLLGIVWVLTSFSAVLLVAVLGLIGWRLDGLSTSIWLQLVRS